MQAIAHNTNEMQWQDAPQYPPGTQIKVLRAGGDSACWTVLLKLPPFWRMEAHTHTTSEQHYVLEGEYESEGRVYTAGSYRLIPKGSFHGPLATHSGAVVLVMWDPVGT